MAAARHAKEDPISDRARELTEEIAALERQIRELGSRLESNKEAQSALQDKTSTPLDEPLFEPVGSARLPQPPPPVRKAKLAPAPRPRPDPPEGIWHRLTQAFRPPESSNPKLINYLAAGSIQGLRPLRYEKRVARNRVVALSLILLFVLWGLIAVLNR